MRRNATIEQVLEGMGKDSIKKVVQSPSKGIMVIVLGVLIFFINAMLSSKIENVLEPALLIAGISLILWGSVIITSRKANYLELKTGQMIEFKERFYDEKQYDKLVSIIESGRYSELMKLRKNPRDGVKLKVATSFDKQMCYVQILKYVPYAFAFTTVVKKLDFDQAMQLLSILQ